MSTSGDPSAEPTTPLVGGSENESLLASEVFGYLTPDEVAALTKKVDTGAKSYTIPAAVMQYVNEGRSFLSGSHLAFIRCSDAADSCTVERFTQGLAERTSQFKYTCTVDGTGANDFLTFAGNIKGLLKSKQTDLVMRLSRELQLELNSTTADLSTFESMRDSVPAILPQRTKSQLMERIGEVQESFEKSTKTFESILKIKIRDTKYRIDLLPVPEDDGPAHTVKRLLLEDVNLVNQGVQSLMAEGEEGEEGSAVSLQPPEQNLFKTTETGGDGSMTYEQMVDGTAFKGCRTLEDFEKMVKALNPEVVL